MRYDIEVYEDYLMKILRKMNVIKIEQLVQILLNTYKDVDRDFAMTILLTLQRRQRIMLSVDGWAMTKGMYRRITNDKFFDGVSLNSKYHIQEFLTTYDVVDGKWMETGETTIESELSTDQKQLIDDFWLVVDMMPKSKNFIIADYPWDFVFDTSGDGNTKPKLYEITHISADDEIQKTQLLRRLPNNVNLDVRDCIRRIAVIENEEHTWIVPKIGFNFICIIDHEEPQHYRVIERRDDDIAWSDYDEK